MGYLRGIWMKWLSRRTYTGMPAAAASVARPAAARWAVCTRVATWGGATGLWILPILVGPIAAHQHHETRQAVGGFRQACNVRRQTNASPSCRMVVQSTRESHREWVAGGRQPHHCSTTGQHQGSRPAAQPRAGERAPLSSHTWLSKVLPFRQGFVSVLVRLVAAVRRLWPSRWRAGWQNKGLAWPWRAASLVSPLHTRYVSWGADGLPIS